MSAKGIPTLFQGIKYRSLAEARWASMMTNLGMRFQYEPFEGNHYIPDFLVLGDNKILVEVKGGAFDLGTLAGHTDKIDAGLHDVWDGDVLLVGGMPMLEDDGTTNYGHPVAGLLRQRGEDEEGFEDWWARGLWMRCSRCGAHGFYHEYGSWQCYPCGHHDGKHHLDDPNKDLLARLWNLATNDTKWRGTR
jgi:hypothetical protein